MRHAFYRSNLPKTYRLAHWVMAIAVLGLMATGGEIHNAAPVFDAKIPAPLTPEIGLAQAVQWHLALAWVLIWALGYLGAMRVTKPGNLARLTPIQGREITRELVATLGMRLSHRAGVFLHVQRLLYWGAYGMLTVGIISGVAIWKPVQLQWVTGLLGGFETLRQIHFLAMVSLVLFAVIHIFMALVVPKTLLAMGLGVAPQRPSPK